MPFVAPLVFLSLPAILVWLGAKDPVRRRLVPRGGPARWVIGLSAVLLVFAAFLIIQAIPDSSDNAWLIVGPAIWALGLGALGFAAACVLSARRRPAFLSGVILAFTVIGLFNIALLSSWALRDGEDLNGIAIRPPVVRVIACTVVAMLVAIGSGRAQPRQCGGARW